MSRLSLLVAALISGGCEVNGSPLPKLNITKGSVSVSGVSSGGAMAIQYHVAYSSRVKGAGVIAGPPFHCARGEEMTAITACMSSPIMINVNLLQDDAEKAASNREIDDLSFLSSTKLFIETGRFDTIVTPGVVSKSEQFYRKYINSTNTLIKSDLPAEHCWPTDSFGKGCIHLGEPYINNCQYDASGVLLKHIYGDLNSRVPSRDDGIVEFDQTLYGASSSKSLGEFGYLYIPESCKLGLTSCSLHVSFHGCQQTVADIGSDFYTKIGLNEWAESNNIVVLYPQIKKSTLHPQNPEGCWDWWGYTDKKYAYKAGPQMAFVAAMIDAISQ